MRKLKNSELERISVENFKKSKKLPVVIILDNIRSALNVGSIFRTADAFRIKKMYLCGITATPPHKDIRKSALGSTDSVDWKKIEKTEDLILDLKQKGYRLFSVEQTSKSILLDQFVLDYTPIALVFGHEVHGVTQSVINLCDNSIEIPQIGTKHSLNVSISAGIVIWDLYQKISR